MWPKGLEVYCPSAAKIIGAVCSPWTAKVWPGFFFGVGDWLVGKIYKPYTKVLQIQETSQTSPWKKKGFCFVAYLFVWVFESLRKRSPLQMSNVSKRSISSWDCRVILKPGMEEWVIGFSVPSRWGKISQTQTFTRSPSFFRPDSKGSQVLEWCDHFCYEKRGKRVHFFFSTKKVEHHK